MKHFCFLLPECPIAFHQFGHFEYAIKMRVVCPVLSVSQKYYLGIELMGEYLTEALEFRNWVFADVDISKVRPTKQSQ